MESMGLPTRAELRKIYAEASGLNVSQIGWYEAFALWKTATVLQQLHHRWVVGDSTDERMASIGARIPALVESAAHLLEGVSRGDSDR
jgi:aminoglycoside phosphotransferase (APT) family kinase protein